MTNTPAIIPARGGSKGVPRKNLKLLGGKPLICWTIEQVLEVDGLVPYVSTEDAEIAEVSAAAGARIIERPEGLSQDTTGSEPVIEHAIEVVTERSGRPEQVMFLQATSPMRLPGTLTRAMDEFHVSKVDSMVGVVPTEIFVWQRHPEVSAHYPWRARPRRQDMTPEQLRYRETGSLYVTRTEIYEREHNRLGGKIGLFVMDASEGLDIDTLEDFDRAEYALARQLAEH